MALFGRSKDEDEEYDDDPTSYKTSRGKLKDLKSENRRKRKEPPKPWGKRERLVVLIVLAVTVLVSGILAFSNQFHLKLGFPKVNFGSLNPFKEETIIIQKK